MNNLNDPPNWNIRPNNDEGEGSKWNYALLVPMLGLAAFRWIWSKESKEEIEKVKFEYHQKLRTIRSDLETKYRDIIVENRRTVAHLEIELEKEQNRTLSYRKALISQSQKLVEERKLMEQEREQLMQEKIAAQRSGAAGALIRSCLEKEEEWQKKANSLLKEFEESLKERQNIYCSLIASRKHRLEIEKNLLVKAASNPIALELKMEDDLVDIFKHDTHCAVMTNTNMHQNGRLMWLYLKYWKLTVEHKKFKRVEETIVGK
ncbi:coiled-coil domain-containing protein 127 isoform 1-T4 [Discoglossus pictus]